MNAARLTKVVSSKAMSSSGGALFQLFLIATLPLDQVGRFNVLVAVTMGLVVFLRSGYDVALLRDASYYWRSDKQQLILPTFLTYLKSAMLKAFLVFVVFIAGNVVLNAAGVEKGLNRTELGFVLVFSILLTLMVLGSSVFKSIQKIVMSSVSENGFCFFIAALVGTVMVFGTGLKLQVESLVLGSACAIVSFGGLLIFFSLYRYKTEEKQFVEIKAETKLFLVNFFSYLSHWGVILIFSAFFSNEDTGKFASAMRFGMLLHFLLMVSNLYVAPKISILFRKGRLNELELLLRGQATVLFFMGIILIILFVAIVNLLALTEQSLEIAEMTMCVLLAQFVNISVGATGYLMTLTHHEKEVLIGSVVANVLGLSVMVLSGVFLQEAFISAVAYMIIPITLTLYLVIRIRKHFGFYSIPAFKTITGK